MAEDLGVAIEGAVDVDVAGRLCPAARGEGGQWQDGETEGTHEGPDQSSHHRSPGLIAPRLERLTGGSKALAVLLYTAVTAPAVFYADVTRLCVPDIHAPP